jgi:hypothetical protein
MACCGRAGAGGQSISARNAARRSTTLAPGQSQSDPIVLGEANGDVYRVRVAIPVEGLRINYQHWVTGDGVQQHFDSGAFIDITGVSQLQRLYRVGAFTYTSLQDANRVAAATGQSVIEVA